MPGDIQRIWVHVGHLAQGPVLGFGTNAILCNPWISSAMAMAMSIYRTLCVLVFLKISLLEMGIAFGNVLS